MDPVSRNLPEIIAGLIARFFPVREFILRTDDRVRFMKIGRNVQLSAVGVVLIAFGYVVYSSVGFFTSEAIILAKDKSILNARLVYRNLLSDVSDYQNRFSTLTGELQKNHSLVLDLVQTNSTLQQNLKSVENKLQDQQMQESEILAARNALKKKLNRIETDMRQLNTHNFKLRGNLNTISTNLESALAERNAAHSKSVDLANQIDTLESQISKLHNAQIETVERLTAGTQKSIDYVATVLAHTGLKISKLVPNISNSKGGQGGPFVAISPLTEPADRLKADLANLDVTLDLWDEAKRVFSALPLPPPLDQYAVSSHFGKRRDPVNNRWAMHYGIDLSAGRKTSVYAPAPGTVRYAAFKGKYGRMIEIKHDYGFTTRYGHLDKILVKRGQKVDYRTEIGLLGSSGRSTGPHLHYEVIRNGQPLNPWRVFKAARYVYKRQ